jgi:hypothetical protein
LQFEDFNMGEYLSKFDGGEMIAITAIVGGLICGAIVMIGEFWRRIRKAEIDAKLKTDMLDRGMSAEEIKVVLEAGSKSIDA